MQEQQQQTFHQSVSKVLFTSQIFALVPISNVLTKQVNNLHYSWLSLQTIYNMLIVLLNSLELATVVKLVLKQGLNFHNSGTLSLFIVCLLEHIYFWRLAIKWSYIMKVWHEVEQIFLRAPYTFYANYNMKFRIYMITLIVLLGALVEHILLLLNSFHKSQLERTQCKMNITYWEILWRRERYHLSLVLPYQVWFLPFFEWTNLTLAYARSFTDVFIMIASIGLATRFHQIYLRIAAINSKAMPSFCWTEIRQHYLMLKHLVRILNKEISPLILLAMGNNMYFICFQLFNSFQNIGVDFVAVSAFWYSLVFAIARTLLTIYIASTVDEYSKKILLALREVPTRSWCLELQRFSEQLAVDLTALSGSGLFFLTRQLILAMASTIITYELMVSAVINEGSIKQIAVYCREY